VKPAHVLLGATLAVAQLASCGSDESGRTAPAEDAGADATTDGDAGPPPRIAEQTFGAFEPWASPIDDYLAVGQAVQPGLFDASINDLAPIGERLFFGYGDANYNLGEQIPIELRFFSSADDPTAQAAAVDGAGQGAPQSSPTQSGEEQIDRYRLLDGVLWQAGIDSIDADELHTQNTTDPKAIDGNVYRLDGDTWQKYRSVRGGEHVHDVASFAGAVYAVGSGADTRLEFEAGQIFRYLWRSVDQGATFETVQRIQHPTPGQGDSRWVTLLPTSSALYLFGYESSFVTNTASVRNAVFDGQSVTDLDPGAPLYALFPDDVLALPDGTALVFGVDVDATPVHYTAGHVAGDGSMAALGSLAGSTVLDADLAATGEIVYLVVAGDAYGGSAPASFDVRVLVADAATPDVASEVSSFTTDVRPTSIAYFLGALFLGTSDGRVLRASAS
jgi:hypothetical protein